MTHTDTLPTRLEAAADRSGTITFVTGATDGPAYTSETVPWAQLHDEARAMAAALQARGAGSRRHRRAARPHVARARDRDPGHLAHRRDRRDAPAADAARLDRRVRRRDATPGRERRRRDRARRSPARGVRARAGMPATSLDELTGDAATVRRRPSVDPDSLAILQFTSGSTADPKGVMLPHRCVTANIDAIRQRRGVRRRPRAGRVVAAAVPRHGSHRAARRADDHRRRPRARRTAGLPRRAGALARLDVDVRVHGHRRARTSPTRSRPRALRRSRRSRPPARGGSR